MRSRRHGVSKDERILAGIVGHIRNVKHCLLIASDNTDVMDVRNEAGKDASYYYRRARSHAEYPVVVPF